MLKLASFACLSSSCQSFHDVLHISLRNMCSFPVAFTWDHVKRLQESSSVSEERNTQSMISNRFKKALLQIYEFLRSFTNFSQEQRLLSDKSWSNEAYLTDVSENTVTLNQMCLSDMFFSIQLD